MEAISTTSYETTAYTNFVGNVETSVGRNITERVVPETEKSSVETGSKRAETSYEPQKAREVEQRDVERREYETRENETKESDQQEYNAQQDLNNYYSKLAASNYVPSDYSSADPAKTASEGVKQSAQNLQNAMSNALQNGMSIQDACNIKSAKAAYEANVKALKTTIEISV